LEDDNLGRRADGLVAPCPFDGPTNGEKFRAWVEPFLVFELKPGDIVILDNLSNPQGRGRHNGHRKRQRPSALPAVLKPRSQPDEPWFAKRKALPRKAAARTFDALINAIAGALETSPRTMCKLAQKLTISTPIMKLL
jgi:hypothetical protein